ncbi:putative E3 ubiquitin-protein ligase/polycomb group RING finger protein [Helianthus annuus]|nr:putative E3 ubiquitin-protein ligase/polycomb group RING finger protein [Helianthus annuus]
MFPAHQSLGGYYYHDSFLSLGGLMAEGADDNIRCSKEATAKDINNNQDKDKDKDKDKEEDGGWLRLSLGSRIDLSPAAGSTSSSSSSPGDHIHEAALTTTPPPPPQQLSFQFRGSIPITPSPPTFFLQQLPSSSLRSRPTAPSGLWFILQPSQTQIKEPYLPQLPKRYLRIKDGRTTVGLLIKYLVYNLQLDAEFEVIITLLTFREYHTHLQHIYAC